MIVRWQPTPGALMRLFCFPYAGGGIAVFRGWDRMLPPEVEVCAVELPGRGRRMRERPYRRLAALVEEVTWLLEPYLDRPFALFGHSMGALIAFETVRALRRTGAPMPVRLLVSGAGVPQNWRRRRALHGLSDAALVEALRDLEGTPSGILASQELLDLLLPIVRADFELIETHVYGPEPPLECPITAFGGVSDRFVGRASLESWREQTTGEFVLRMLPGGHFFLGRQGVFLPTLCASLLPMVTHAAASVAAAPCGPWGDPSASRATGPGDEERRCNWT